MIVYQTDFGLKDGAVSAMRGVAVAVDPALRLEDLTHEIPASTSGRAPIALTRPRPTGRGHGVRLGGRSGVGTDRNRSAEDQLRPPLREPDNGTLTLVAEDLGIAAVREIDEGRNRRPARADAHLPRPRRVHLRRGASRLGPDRLRGIGPELPAEVVRIDYQKPARRATWCRQHPDLDVQSGNVWTNIDRATFEQLGVGGRRSRGAIFKASSRSSRAPCPMSRPSATCPRASRCST